MKKKTIGKKILNVIFTSLLVLAITMGTISVYMVEELSKENSEKIMTEICENEALKFDNKLNLVSHSVQMIYEYAKELSAATYEEFDVYSEEYEKRVNELAVSVANNTEGAMAVYFRYNPEITGNGTGGFFYSRDNDNDVFHEEPPTDILAYFENDIEHVGWFYVPKKTGNALWMKPYLNQNLNVFMISYIIPVYLNDGEFVGVLGMDIDFYTILSATGNANLYNTGSISLVDVADRIIYKDDHNGGAINETLSSSLYNYITTINRKNDVLTIYDDKGNASAICCKKLNNDMMMCVTVPLKEINSRRDSLAIICILSFALAFIGTTIVILRITRRIINPLKDITEITKKYANGEWNESYICDTNDEIEDLSKSVSIMAQNTQKYINEINNLARRDVMTGIYNKTYYVEAVERIKAEGSAYEYAVVVMDLNLLKKANDVYGHEAGDMLIKEAAKYISNIFSRSEVFRIGGDEFVAMLTSDDYNERVKLLKNFEEGMFYTLEEYPELKLAISFGMASHPAEAVDYDVLFALADQRMYEKKKEMKLGRTD